MSSDGVSSSSALGTVSQLLQSVAFPILVAAYLLVQMEPRLDAALVAEQHTVDSLSVLSNACYQRSTRPP